MNSIKIDGYELKNKLDPSCMPKASYLVTNFFDTAFSELDDLGKKHAISSIFNGIKSGIKRGVYIYDNDELVGLAVYHVEVCNPKNIAIDLIDFDPEIRKSYVNMPETEQNNKPSVLLTSVIKIIAGVAKKNGMESISFGLTKEVSYLGNNFKDLGFSVNDEHFNKNIDVYSKKLVMKK